MKQVIVLSDSHGLLEPDVMRHLKEADEIWHAGDWGGGMNVLEQIEKLNKPIQGVYGNIDGGALRQVLPLIHRFECEGMRVWMTHIGGYPGKYAKGIKERLIQDKPHVFICGHSHILKVIYDKEIGVMHLNPGACGRHGFHQVRTLLRLQIAETKIQKAEVIELGKRTQSSVGESGRIS